MTRNSLSSPLFGARDSQDIGRIKRFFRRSIYSSTSDEEETPEDPPRPNEEIERCVRLLGRVHRVSIEQSVRYHIHRHYTVYVYINDEWQTLPGSAQDPAYELDYSYAEFMELSRALYSAHSSSPLEQQVGARWAVEDVLQRGAGA
ncbi:hypothetical protein P43SY_004448 [Pythium insidiosum]|uniref:Uncharacterized protein n=1 Tax=Pythium insidiosum TaxID=114742 RepID=A0AAD5LMI5_PYTIN|nr:hypothetical protein P43SY_004448 [Pythium insidiosum]